MCMPHLHRHTAAPTYTRRQQSRPLPSARCLHRDRAPYSAPAGGGSRVAAHTPSALRATRQNANSLSAANKLLIRCAWAGTPAFASAVAMTRAGRREAALEALIEVCVRPGQSLGGCPYHSPQLVRGVHTYTDVREGR